MPTKWSLDTLDSLLPVVGACALHGVRVDIALRKQMRREVAEVHADLLGKFEAEIGAFAAGKREALERALGEACERRDYFRRAAKGQGLFDAAADIAPDEAERKWKEHKKKAEDIRADIVKYTAVGPTKKEVIRDFLFRDKAGLRLKPPKRTASGLESVGKKELSALLNRADVQAKMAKDPRCSILRTLAEAERLRSVAALHLGIASDDGEMNLRADTQLHKGRLAVVYNPVKLRFSSGATGDKPHPNAIQMHNPPKELKGGGKVWHIRRQFLPDRDDQVIAKFDWKAFESYVMAWQCGNRLGDWSWLRWLYDGIDPHCRTACIIEPTLKDDGCRGGDDCPHRAVKINMGAELRPARDGGKQINHAYTLGGRENFLKEQYQIPVADGRRMLERMDASPHGLMVKALHEHIQDEAVREESVSTPFGESIDFWSFETKGDRRVPRNPRECYGVAQQGTAALIMQSRMGPVDAAARRHGGRLVMTIHDEFVVCVRRDSVSGTVDRIRAIMSAPVEQMPVPFDGGRGLSIPVDAGVGPSWGDCK